MNKNIFDAKEARKMLTDRLESLIEKQLEYICTCIKVSINEGINYVDIYVNSIDGFHYTTSDIITRLKNLGYDVHYSSNQKNEYFLKIKW